MSSSRLRRIALAFLWLTGIGHLLGGLALVLASDSAPFHLYHRDVLARFWPGEPPAAALAQQSWMVALFGATIQNIGVWLMALTHWGGRRRDPAAWAWLLVGISVWAVQDIAVSMQVRYTPHLWLDLAAWTALAIPAAWLWRHDRSARQ